MVINDTMKSSARIKASGFVLHYGASGQATHWHGKSFLFKNSHFFKLSNDLRTVPYKPLYFSNLYSTIYHVTQHCSRLELFIMSQIIIRHRAQIQIQIHRSIMSKKKRRFHSKSSYSKLGQPVGQQFFPAICLQAHGM